MFKLNIKNIGGILATAAIFLCAFPVCVSYANPIKPSPNYLIILVPGFAAKSEDIFMKEYGNLDKYLREDLGLDGYVYPNKDTIINFSNGKGSNIDHAKELADPSNTNNWFKQAKTGFVNWFKTKGPGLKCDPPRDPTEAEIPKKYLVISHSEGGLAARSYITSDYYNDDVKKMIFVDTPHLGSDGVVYKKLLISPESIFGSMSLEMIYAYVALKIYSQSGPASIHDVYFWGALIAAGFMPAEQLLFKDLAGTWGDPGVVEADPDGSFVQSLNNKIPKQDSNSLNYRLISARGFPTPDKESITALNAFRNAPVLGALYSIFDPDWWNLPTTLEKLESLIMGTVTGGVAFTKDGSFIVSRDSSKAENIEMFRNNTRRYEYLFNNPGIENVLNDLVPDLLKGAVATHAFLGFAPAVSGVYWVPTLAVAFALAEDMVGGKGNDFWYRKDSHGNILQKIQEGKPSIIEQAIFDEPIGVVTGLQSPSTQTVTVENASQAVLASAANEQTVKQGIPLIINSQEAYLPSIVVKSPIASIEGIIYDFKPLDLTSFAISENFAVWQEFMKLGNIKEKNAGKIVSQAGKFRLEIDNWGKFTISGFNLAEGNNVIAFNLANRAYSNNQSIGLTQNTIPLFVGKASPEAGSFTSDINKTIAVEATKAGFSNNEAETIQAISFVVDGIERLSEIKLIKENGTYGMKTRAEWMPAEQLNEGEHQVAVKFQSNIGVAQAAWSFTVDTTSPLVTVATLEPYAPRSPTAKPLVIKYATSDNHSQFLKNTLIRAYQGTEPDDDTNFVTQITSIATQAAGEQFVSWDGKKADGNYVEDGVYSVKVKTFDQAGNASSSKALLTIDSNPPQIITAAVSPDPVTSATSEAALRTRVTEKSQVTIKFTNQADNQISAYLTQANQVDSGQGTGDSYLASYTWKYDDLFSQGLKDGVYCVEVIARDEAGNESEPFIINNVKIDRTPPVISTQHTNPFVLANTGDNPYFTKLFYRLSEANDSPANKQSSDNLNLKIKLFEENSGRLVGNWPAMGSLSNENVQAWNGQNETNAKGTYKFQITAYDQVGNFSTAYATCVKDGIAPVITFPGDKEQLSGTVAIRGTAMDPDWTNDRKFKQYSVYYKKGWEEEGEWAKDLVEVPEIYRAPGSTDRNISVRPVQNDATLAYFYTTSLPNGDYTLRVSAEEDGDVQYGSIRKITVKNDQLIVPTNPLIEFDSEPASSFNFSGANSLPIGFKYGGKELNAYVEILKLTAAGTKETAFYKYFPKLSADYYLGKPAYKTGGELGYFIWQDETGWHVRWNGESDKEHRFSGAIVAAGEVKDFNQVGDGSKQTMSIISWEKNISGGEGGFNFKTSAKQLIITTYLNNDPSTLKDEYSSMTTPYFGMGKYQPSATPVIIAGIAGESPLNRQTIDWNGKTESGAFVDSGDYIIRLRTEGADGNGLALQEKSIAITTPFDLFNVQVNASLLNPMSNLLNSVSVSYNISKDAHILLKVYRKGDENKTDGELAVIDEGIVSGKPNADYPRSVTWRGNFPDKNGTQMVIGGEYVLKLIAIPADGKSIKIEKTIVPDIKVDTGYGSSSSAKLDDIGEEVNYKGGMVKATQGSSTYFWNATASGTYYPPLSYTFTLGVQGKQKVSLYPYVPFAGIMHRGFNEVNTKIRVVYQIEGGMTEPGPSPKYFETKGKIKEKWFEGINFFPSNKNAALPAIQTNLAKEIEENNGSGVLEKAVYQINFFDAKILSIEVYSKDGSFVLDSYKLPPVGVSQSGKGMFGLNAKYNYSHNIKGENIYPLYNPITFDLTISLANSISYSRLTNRFVPWYGFINAKHPSYEAFSNMASFLQKLGFPGGDYFNNPNKTLADYKAEIGSEYPPDIYDASIYTTKDGRMDKTNLNEKTTSKLAGDTLVSAPESYLGGEYMEFIPIQVPDGGSFDYPASIFEGKDPVNNYYRLKVGLDKYSFKASTVYRSGYENGNTPELKWPKDDAEVMDENNKLMGPMTNLIANPQSYNIENTAKEIDIAELASRESEFAKDNPGVKAEGGWYKLQIPAESIKIDKNRVPVDYFKDLKVNLGGLINLSNNKYLASYTYQAFNKTPNDLNLSYDPHNYASNISVSIPAASHGQAWSTKDDPVIAAYAGGILSGDPETFNKAGFSLDNRSQPIYFKDVYHENYLKYQLNDNSRCLFLRDLQNPDNLIKNPDLFINNWTVEIRDEAKQINQDISVEAGDINYSDPDPLNHFFRTKLNYYSREKRIVKLTGVAVSDYELKYFDGNKWVSIANGPRDEKGVLAYWDVGRLCGKYTVLLKTGNAIDSKDVYIGKLIPFNLGGSVESAYRRAAVYFKPNSFATDQFSSVTPVTMSQIDINNKPIIKMQGPIVELKPSPVSFSTSARPSLVFTYTAKDISDGYGINIGPADMAGDGSGWKAKVSQLWIHQLTADGNLEPVQKTNISSIVDGDNIAFAFESDLDHFSTYALLPGKFSLSAPVVFADSYITNKNTVTIYGTAEPNSIVTLYVKNKSNFDLLHDSGEGGRLATAGEAGNFRFENVDLVQEGSNYIYVTSHPQGNTDVMTYSDVTIIKDTVPPSVEASQNLYAFSPNGDGKYDSVDYIIKSNESGKIYLQLTTNSSTSLGASNSQLLNVEISVEANKEIRLTWTKDGFDIYRRNSFSGVWEVVSRQSLVVSLIDGAYQSTVYAIDQAGNESSPRTLEAIRIDRYRIMRNTNAEGVTGV